MISVNLFLAKYLNVLYTLKTRPRLYPKTQTFPESPPWPHTRPRIWPRGGPSAHTRSNLHYITMTVGGKGIVVLAAGVHVVLVRRWQFYPGEQEQRVVEDVLPLVLQSECLV